MEVINLEPSKSRWLEGGGGCRGILQSPRCFKTDTWGENKHNKYVSLLSLLLQSIPAYFAVKTFSLLNDQSSMWSNQVNNCNKPEQQKYT